MKKLCFVFACFLIISHAYSQVIDTKVETELRKQPADSTKGWKKGFTTNINFSQAQLVNWSLGGDNTMALTSFANFYANYHSPVLSWVNTLDLGYGLQIQEKLEPKRKKTDDRIDFVSKLGRKAINNFYYTGLVNVRTQFDLGYNYPNDSVVVSDFISPIYVIGALGMDYQPNTYFTAFLAAVTGRLTYINSQALANNGVFGVKAGERSLVEIGGYLRISYSKADFKNEWLKNISIKTNLALFSNYLKQPENVDVNWDAQILFSINKVLAVSLNTLLIYDHDVNILVETLSDGTEIKGPRVQFREILGLGITYTINK